MRRFFLAKAFQWLLLVCFLVPSLSNAQPLKEQIVGIWTMVSADSVRAPEENKAIVQGSIAYFGNYTVNEADKTLTLKLAGSTYANLLASGEQKRLITTLTADELKFTNPRTPSGMTLEVALKRMR